jgi:hypothetical protein
MGADENEHRTSRVHDESVTTMGRRRFVDTLLSAGFGALSAAFLTAEDVQAASRDEVPIVYGLARDDEGEFRPRRKTVPADWYDDFRSAVGVHRNLELVTRENVASSAVAPGEYGGVNAAIHVEVTEEQARGEVPERVEDTPIEVRRVKPSEEQESSRDGEDVGGTDDPPGVGNADEDDSSGADSVERDSSPVVSQEGGIPGSVEVASEDLYGTLAPAMQDPTDGSLYFATANHIFDGSDSSGSPLYLFDGGRTQIGTVHESHPKVDVACARPGSDYYPLHRIREGDPGRVLGQFTEVGLADLKADDEPLEKIGVKTGHTKGKIQAVDGFTCAYGAICKRGQLKWGRESGFADGDSGSVNYHPDPDDPDAGVLVGGFNNARTWWPGENYIWGTAAYHVTEKHGLTF